MVLASPLVSLPDDVAYFDSQTAAAVRELSSLFFLVTKQLLF